MVTSITEYPLISKYTCSNQTFTTETQRIDCISNTLQAVRFLISYSTTLSHLRVCVCLSYFISLIFLNI